MIIMETDLYALGLTELWPLVLGVVLPPFISMINRVKWSAGLKSGVMLASVFATTLFGEWISGNLIRPEGIESLFRSLFVVFLLTVTTYRHVWKPTGIAPRIEAATDRAKDETEDDTEEPYEYKDSPFTSPNGDDSVL